MQGRRVLVTGGGTGIGRSTALRLAGAGADVIVVGRRAEPLERVAEEAASSGGRVRALSADLENAASIGALAASVLEEDPAIDTVVHNAGHNSRVRSARFISDDEWASVLAVNLTGPMRLTRSLLPSLLESGRGTVILVSSMAALRPGPMSGIAYGAAKAAAANYLRGLAAELRQEGLRCTTIFPGEVDTPILEQRALVPSAADRATMMRPEDVAEAILLAAALPQRTVIEELTMMPTQLRNTSADAEAAKRVRPHS